MSSQTSADNLSILASLGSFFADFHRKSSKPQRTIDSIVEDHESVVGNIRKVIEVFKNDSMDKKCKVKALGKIHGILQQKIKNHPKCKKPIKEIADEIQNRIQDFVKSQEQSSFSDSNTWMNRMLNDSFEVEGYNRILQDFADFKDTYGKLSEKEKSCLSFSYFFLSSSDSTAKIYKSDLVQWWVGMGLIENVSNGEEVLKKLVTEKLLLSSINGKYYTKPAINTEFEQLCPQYKIAQKERLYVVHRENIEGNSTGVPAAHRIEVAINNNAYTLNAKIFEWVFDMTNAKVVHLGCWHKQMDYVVVEDMIVKRLNSLTSLQEVQFLSFRGISRLETLPTSVYMLLELKVLDLRACQDLCILPLGIKSLTKLIHLDLTECYELEFIPNEIARLTQLKVLKGFLVINPADSRNLDAERRFNSSSCTFTSLTTLTNLTKLTIRTRIIDFPTGEDVKTLGNMVQLDKLKITWVHTKSQQPEARTDADFYIEKFPTNLKQLELEAAPEKNVIRLLNLISNRSKNGLQKLYIRGGGISKLEPQKFFFPNIKVVRFRYLSKLHMNWYEFNRSFPNVTRFEIFKCSYLIFFPVDENGVWEK